MADTPTSGIIGQVKVLKLSRHKGTSTTSFFCASPKDPNVICFAKANFVGLNVGDVLSVYAPGTVIPEGTHAVIAIKIAEEKQLKEYNSVSKNKGSLYIDESLFE